MVPRMIRMEKKHLRSLLLGAYTHGFSTNIADLDFNKGRDWDEQKAGSCQLREGCTVVEHIGQRADSIFEMQIRKGIRRRNGCV